jgi:TRAP-type C4-dicarboxylate transport system permease small subunit
MLRRLLTCADAAMRWLAGIAAAGLTLCVLLGVVSRAINDPLAWTDELSRFLMIWVAILGWMLATRRRAHIRIRFFHDLLPPFWWRVAEIAMQFAVAGFGLLVVAYGLELVARNRDVEATTVPLTIMWFYLPIVVAGLVATAQAVADIGAIVTKRGGPTR